MYTILKYIFIIIIIFLFIIYIYCDDIDKYLNTIERFEDMFDNFEKYEEIYDKEFVDFYEIIYRDFGDIDKDTDIIFKKIFEPIENKENINVLVGGCGVGKLCKKIKDKYKNVIGVDISENMLNKAQILYPNIKFVRGNICKNSIFKKNTFSHIYIDERTLYYNKDIDNIIKNSFDWLSERGFLIIQIYDPENLKLAARYYSTNYIDDKQNLHGFTYLNNFSHDCYYIKGTKENEIDYYDKIILEDGKKRIKKTTFYIPPKENVYDTVLNNGFELFYIEKIRDLQIVGGYELVIFRKKSTQSSVEDIENNKK